jgi:hypothetical protein
MAFVYVQTIYDTTLAQTVWYETAVPTASPNPASTTPVSSGSYNSTTHLIVQVYDDPNTGGGGGESTLVYDPLAVPSGNVHSTWSSLYTALSAMSAPVEIALKADLSIPAGSWTLTNVKFIGYIRRPILTLQDGAVCSFNSLYFDSVDLQWVGTTASPLVPAVVAGTPAGVIYIQQCDISATAVGSVYPLMAIPATGVGGIHLRDVSSVGTSNGERLVSIAASGFFVTDILGSDSFVDNEAYSGSGILVIVRACASSTHGTVATYSGAVFQNSVTKASEVNYVDTVAPALTVTNVQDAVDALKLRIEQKSDLLFQWNKTDLSQFTQVGIAGQWTVAYSATAAPGSNPAIVATSAVASATSGYLLLPALDLTKPYVVEVTFGPYTGNAVATERVRPEMVFHYFDTSNYCYVAMQANNVNGNGAVTANLEVGQIVAGTPTYNQPGAYYTSTNRAKGVVRTRCVPSPASNILEVNIQTARNTAWYELAANNLSSASARVGIRFTHYGASQTTGDSGFVYGIRVMRAGGT